MKKFFFIFIILNFSLHSCSKDETQDDIFNATVLKKGLDCGNLFLIQFNDDVSAIPENNFENIFYAMNLPEVFKIEGKQIKIRIRKPKNEEAMACTTFGISYPHIYVINAE